MGGEAATRTRCSAARWFRSLVLALSKCLVAAAPKIRPVVSMAPAGCVAGPADCKVLDWLPHFLRREQRIHSIIHCSGLLVVLAVAHEAKVCVVQRQLLSLDSIAQRIDSCP